MIWLQTLSGVKFPLIALVKGDFLQLEFHLRWYSVDILKRNLVQDWVRFAEVSYLRAFFEHKTSQVSLYSFRSGVALSYFTIQKSFYLLLITYGFMFGVGQAITYNCVLICVQRVDISVHLLSTMTVVVSVAS
jgi:hypothetical protein